MGGSTTIQIPSLVIPATWDALTDVENLTDLLIHNSVVFPVGNLQECALDIMALETNPGGALGNLQIWVELSPYPSANNIIWPAPLPASTAYWHAIGGGGGAQVAGAPIIAPVAPLIIVPSGNGRTHTEGLAWTNNSQWCRVIAYCPVNAGLPTDLWTVQVWFSGKGG